MLEDLPLAWANLIAMGLFALLLVLCWVVPNNLIFLDAPDRSRWRDLRVWASALIVIQIGVYILFS